MINAANNRPVTALLAVEDPGAAVFFQYLPNVLMAEGWNVQICGLGKGAEALRRQGFELLSLDGKSVKFILEKLRPDILMSGFSVDPNSPVLQLIDQAKQTGIATVAIADSIKNIPYRYWDKGQDPFFRAPDLVLTPDTGTAKGFQDVGFERSRIEIIGNPHFENLCEVSKTITQSKRSRCRRRHFPAARSDQRVIVLLSEPELPVQSARNDDVQSGFNDWSPNCERIRFVLDLLLSTITKIGSKDYVVVRLHPRNHVGEFNEYQGIVDFSYPDTDSNDVVIGADLVVGLTSSLVAESALLGTPTISVLLDSAEAAELPQLTPGNVIHVKNKKEFRAALAKEHSVGIPQNSEYSKQEPRQFARLVARVRQLVQ